MKKTVCITAMLVLAASISITAKKKKSVVDYFSMLDGEAKIVKKGNNWTCAPPPYGSYEAPLVDLKNGYLKTVYQGGDGSEETEAALFLNEKHEPFLGVTKFQDGIGGDYEITFYSFSDGKPSDVTRDILPKLDVSLFLKRGYDKILIQKYRQKAAAMEKNRSIRLIQFACMLPRYGTVVTVSLHFKQLETYGGNDLGDMLHYYRYIKKNAVKKKILLSWDGKNSKFVLK